MFQVRISEITFPMAKAFEWSCVSSTGSQCALSNFATPTATDGSGTAGAQITVAGVDTVDTFFVCQHLAFQQDM